MSPHDPRVDAYIEHAAPFARPLLAELRRRVHAAGQEIDESIKWRHPAFLHGGRIVAFMAAFKAHVGFGFWTPKGADDADGMGQFGRITGIEMLPTQARINAGLREAIARHAMPAPRARAPRPELETPAALRIALDANPAAKAAFEAFAPSHRREYAEWIADAKRETTRTRRVAQAIEWLAEGRPRNWKYMSRG
ncbi:YdeI/OmpD-associated family protein [Lysobacter humi (ex Lee et al. 2017)]